MAKFVKQTSDVAMALDKLQGLAEGLISMETNRRIQLGKEKEARVADAYKYLIGQEDAQIREYQTSIDAVTQNLFDRGIELESVKDQYKTVASEELLTAANESAISMLNVMLGDAQNQSDSYRNKMREVNKIKRHIDLFDDAISLVDPGADQVVDASDVAEAANKFLDAQDKYAPEIEQRLKELQTEGELDRLQEDYYVRLAKESQQKVTAAAAENMTADIKIKTLEPIKKESQEAVKAMTYQPVSKMVEEYGVIISRQAEIAALEPDDKSSDKQEMEQQIIQEEMRLGSILYPWAYSPEQSQILAQGMQTALTKVVKNGDYYDLINYFKQGNAQYKLMMQQGNPLAETYRADVQSMLGIDIASDDWVSQLIELNEISGRIDIEQATEAIKIGRSLLPEEKEVGTKDSLMEKYGF